MKKLIAVLCLFLSSAHAEEIDLVTDALCTYHSTIVSEAVEQMRNGKSYSEAIDYSMSKFEKDAGEVVLNLIEISLQTLPEGDAYMIGNVTGLATQFWASQLLKGTVRGNKDQVFKGSFQSCVMGANDTDVSTYFLSYQIALEQELAPPSHRM